MSESWMVEIKALAAVKCPALVVGITTDIIFTVPEMKRLADLLPNARYREIASPFGHDGFLCGI